jgi:pre-mRNA-processing factor 39
MLVFGRGSIANVQYTGDEAAAEIRKLLEAVVGSPASWNKLRNC